MKSWLTRNRWAFAVIAVMSALIAATVVYPTWWRSKGYLRPAETVAYGQSTVIDGVTWQLEHLTLPNIPSDDEAPGGRWAGYVLTREVDGNPAPAPKNYSRCLVSLVGDDGVRWLGKPVPNGLYRWLYDEGFTTSCALSGPVLVLARVPTGASVVAVELLVSRFAGEGVEVAPDPSRATTVVRFDTG